MLSEAIQETLGTLPSAPGVYLFRDHEGQVLYVGKARSLRSRVRSYFQPGTSDVRAFVARLERELGQIQTFVVATEKEAALLESQLIKEHRPRYNVKLRDDKSYLSLRLDPQKPWPRLEVVRRPRADGAQYFGPYDSASGARKTLRLINRHFQLRTCTDAELRNRSRPCLQYQIRRCPAPCVGEVSEPAYREQVRDVGLFLRGRHDELLLLLGAKMREAAAQLRYEEAAIHRDQIEAIERVREEQSVSSVRDRDQDALGYYREGDRAEIALLVLRQGKLVGVHTEGVKGLSAPDDELIASFVAQHYARGAFVPDEILLPRPIEAMQGLAELLGEQKGRKVAIRAPQRGPSQPLLRMARQNAEHAYGEKRRAKEDAAERLAEVQRRLGLEAPPRRIECVDISHSAGQDTVAALTVLLEGAPARASYRSYRVRRSSGGDDYGAMYEVLARRLRRAAKGESGWELPDLLVVDGGKGQLGVALAAAKDMGVSVPLAALAKEKVRGDGAVVDRVFVPGRKNPIELRAAPALQMLAVVRDEAHRFSNALRLRSGKRRGMRSALDEIPGVGPKTRQRLLGALLSVDRIAAASEEELRIAGASRAQAAAIRARLGPRPRAASAGEDPVADPQQAEERALSNAFAELASQLDSSRDGAEG